MESYNAGGFAPANFDELAPFDDVPYGYGTAVNAIVTKQMDEIRQKTAALDLRSTWKKRFREFISGKHKDLLDFLEVSVPSHPTFGQAELLLRRFGNPQVTPSHPSVKEFVLDGSGINIDNLNGAVDAAFTGGLKGLAASTQLVYDRYRAAGEEILKQQGNLKQKLDNLNRIQGKITTLFEIGPNNAYGTLMEASEAYIKILYDENQISTEYSALIEAYREFIAIREIIESLRATSSEHEPICSICLTESVSYAITPCGHTYCQSCILRQVQHCPLCRGTIKEKVRLYFG